MPFLEDDNTENMTNANVEAPKQAIALASRKLSYEEDEWIRFKHENISNHQDESDSMIKNKSKVNSFKTDQNFRSDQLEKMLFMHGGNSAIKE